MTDDDATALPPPALAALQALHAGLDGAGLPAQALVLLAPDADALAQCATAAVRERAEACAPGRPQAVVLPPLASLGLAPALAQAALAGRSAFELGAQLLLQLGAALPPGRAWRLAQRLYLRPAAAGSARGRHDIALYCKTYRGDFARVQVLLESFRRHNRQALPLYLSCPADDLPLFAPLAGGDVTLLADEQFAGPHLAHAPMNGMSTGYINQQVCKLTFHLTGLADNHLSIDSDTVFIRDFDASDFMHGPGLPYTVLVMDKDLSIERHYRPVHWVGRQQAIARIYDQVGLRDRRLRTCHNAQVMNATVLASLQADFMRPRGLDYVALLRLAPYEYTWYNAWFQHCRLVPEVAVEPFFKMLHMRPEYLFSRLRLLREQDYAEAYVGLVMNSKWRPATPLRYADPGPAHAALYATLLGDEEAIERLRLLPPAAAPLQPA